MKRRFIATLCACLLAATPVAAQTAAQLDQAKALFNAGAQAYAVGQYPAAIQAFEEAYKITPRPAILFSLAQAERRQYSIDHDPKRLERAVEGFRKYIVEVPQGGRRADAVAALGELEPQLEKEKQKGATAAPPPPPPKVTARVMVTSPTPNAQIAVDGGGASEAPFIGEVSPGKHTVVVIAAGHEPERREIQIVEGGLVALDLPLKEKPALLRIEPPAGSEVTIDGRLVGVAPLTAPVELGHGRHFVAVMRNGSAAWTRDVDVVRGETTTVTPSLATSTQRKVAWGFLGGSTVSLLAGGAFGFVALSKEHQASAVLDERDRGSATPARLDEYDKLRTDRDRFRTWSIVSFGTGAVLGMTGLLLYALDRPSTPMRDAPPSEKAPSPKSIAPAEVSALPIVGPTLVGASVAITF